METPNNHIETITMRNKTEKIPGNLIEILKNKKRGDSLKNF